MGRVRSLSTKRLGALSAGLVAAVAVGTTIALAAGGGAKPRPRPLDQAIHRALTGPTVPGVSARIRFTNHLIDSSGVEGVNPILKGASGRLWASADGHVRLELQSSDGAGGDAVAVIGPNGFSVYDPAANTLYRGKLPRDGVRHREKSADGPPSLAAIDRALAELTRHARLSGAQPGNVGGKPAYSVKVSPKQNGGLLGGVGLAWDASRAVPLKATVYAKGGVPVLELKATKISYARIASADLAAPDPPGAKVVDLGTKTVKRSRREHGGKRHAEGLAAVRAAVPFTLAAPLTLAGRQRTSVKLIGSGGDAAALVTYGRDLDGIVVVESRAKHAAAARADGEHHHGRELSLPKVSIDGRPGQQFETALGSVVRFERGGVSYVVAGSVPTDQAVAAARGL